MSVQGSSPAGRSLGSPLTQAMRPVAMAATATMTLEPVAVARAEDPGPEGAAADGGSVSAASSTDAAPAVTGPCADQHRAATERCAIAERARGEARSAADALHAVQRAYDEHLTRVDRAQELTDPRAVRARKEAAQRAFRDARAAAATPDAVEGAARDWLHEINQINTEVRDAAHGVDRERESVRRLVPTIERLALEADAARIGAEIAEVACREAREAVARCEEAVLTQLATPRATPDAGPGPGAATAAGAPLITGGGLPVVIALLRGDRQVLERLVAELGGDDAEERRRWRLRLAALVDAIVARAIEAAYLAFPEAQPFWGTFSDSQGRDIAAALASMGYRFDGRGDFVDERHPSQRDLSMAVGYAGIDPMRIRHWPTEQENAELYREAVVLADEWLAEAAGELTLGEMIDALGRRADDLADIWNEWGRLRPLLLADA